jgi:hypothetical protein
MNRINVKRKKMKKKFSVAFLCFWASITVGQDFFDSLRTEASRLLNCSYDYVNVDSLNTAFFDSNNVRMLIDSSAKYQVMFIDSNSWCSGPHCDNFVYGSNYSYIKYPVVPDEEDLFQLNIPRKKYYHCSKIYSGTELIQNVKIMFHDTIFIEFPYLEQIYKYNGKWTVFSNENYLIFRHARIYIGNTSTFDEELIYLKKVEKSK